MLDNSAYSTDNYVHIYVVNYNVGCDLTRSLSVEKYFLDACWNVDLAELSIVKKLYINVDLSEIFY